MSNRRRRFQRTLERQAGLTLWERFERDTGCRFLLTHGTLVPPLLEFAAAQIVQSAAVVPPASFEDYLTAKKRLLVMTQGAGSDD